MFGSVAVKLAKFVPNFSHYETTTRLRRRSDDIERDPEIPAILTFALSETPCMNVDAIEARLTALAGALADELGDLVSVSFEDWEVGRSLEIFPRNSSALSVLVWDFGSELQLEAGHNGGRWELKRDLQDMDFIEDVVRSVVAGRVEEVFGPGRSRVEVTLRDGSIARETGGVAPRGCLPVPGWVRRGRRVRYAPYTD